jgi:hypothetical protein
MTLPSNNIVSSNVYIGFMLNLFRNTVLKYIFNFFQLENKQINNSMINNVRRSLLNDT